MDGLITLSGNLALLLVLGTAFGCFDRKGFSPRWLLIAALLVIINDALLTRFYGLLPGLIPGQWNWDGKLLALAATVAIAILPAFGLRRSGFTFSQAPGSLKAVLPVAALYCLFFVVLAFVFPGGQYSSEDIAFQLTMPGFEEEPFWRGILLVALSQAFTSRKRFLGVDWAWGAVLACLLFGMGHAFGFSDGSFSFDPITMTLTTVPSFFVVWMRLRTGSLLLPVLLHNFGNSFSMLV